MTVSARDSLSAGRFLGWLIVTAAMGFGLVWACMFYLPLAMFGGNHVMWAAKDALLRQCGLGTTIVVGDSRAQNGIIPALLPKPSTNLATGGFSTIETYFATRRALQCNGDIKRVIISLSATSFIEPLTLWTNAAQVGMLSVRDLREVVGLSDRLGDTSIDRVERQNDLPDALRVWLYPSLFPPINFADMLDGVPFVREPFNRMVVSQQVQSHGFYPFPDVTAAPGFIAHDGEWAKFVVPPVMDHFFDRTLAMLSARGIEVDFIAMPVNPATAQAITHNILSAFTLYLHAYETRYASFRVIGSLVTAWPDELFGDGQGHLGPRGADSLSKVLAVCLKDLNTWDRHGAPPVACDLSWRAAQRLP